MESVREKLSVLSEDFMEGLYYDREGLLNEASFEEGLTKGVLDTKFEIAKAMLKENLYVDIIYKSYWIIQRKYFRFEK